jgi:hypothetical protein
VVPTISFRLLYGLILQHDRRQILWLGVTAWVSAPNIDPSASNIDPGPPPKSGVGGGTYDVWRGVILVRR